MLHDHHDLIVLTCWEGPVIVAVTTWIETHFQQTATHIITESAPEQMLLAAPLNQQTRLYDKLTFALNNAADPLIILAGHAGCLDALAHPQDSSMDVMRQAMTILQDLVPTARVYGLWLDYHAEISPVPPTPGVSPTVLQ